MRERNNIRSELSEPAKMIFNQEDRIKYNESELCWICEREIYPNYGCQCDEPQKPKTEKQKEKYIFENKKGYEEYICVFCKKKINKFRKVRDHCHITGKFRGAAHDRCNLKLQIRPERTPIPVILHNI